MGTFQTVSSAKRAHHYAISHLNEHQVHLLIVNSNPAIYRNPFRIGHLCIDLITFFK